MNKNINNRCPLSGECERRSCDFVGHELDCIYYETNGIDDNGIPDQEECRLERQRQTMRQEEDRMMAEMVEQHPERTIEVITTEILLYKQQAGDAILQIGTRLIEAKAQLAHGEWLPWLREKVEFSEVTAQRFMRIAKEYKNPSLVTDLGASKALVLLTLPASERENFVAEKHTVSGEEKSVMEMSKRELEKAIRERNEAQKEVKEARSRADQLEHDVRDYANQLKRIQEEAAKRMDKADEVIVELKQQLENLKSQPQQVAVEKVVDQDAVDQAAKAAREKAEAELGKRLEKAIHDRANAEKAKHQAEQDLAAVRVANKEAEAIASKEREDMMEQMEQLRKKLAMASSSEMTVFKLYFDACQTNLSKMAECIDKMAEAGNAADAEKLKRAMTALLKSRLEEIE